MSKKTAFCISSAASSNVLDDGVTAYAKLSGDTWTYYVQDLSICVGRSYDNPDTHSNEESVDLDLGKSKIISRKHARIAYNFNTRKWEIFILGRNGLKLNSVLFKDSEPIALDTNTMIEIGGIQFQFILPPPAPIEPEIVERQQEFEQHPIHHHPLQHHRPIYPLKKASHPRQNPPPNLQKPPYSYATLIAEAINSNPEKKITLSGIYNYIVDHYEFYQYSTNGWQNSVRHNLSLNKAFKKVPRNSNEAGKGMHWTIDPEFEGTFEDTKKRARSGYREGDMMKRMRAPPFDPALKFPLPMWNPNPFYGFNPFMFPPPGPMPPHPIHHPIPIYEPVIKKEKEPLIQLPSPGLLMSRFPKEFFNLKLIDV